MKALMKSIAPVVLMLAFIFLFSSIPYALQDLRPFLSGERVNGWLNNWLAHVRLHYNGREISIKSMGAPAVAEFILRKLAHLALYCCLAYCFMLAIRKLTGWSIMLSSLVTFTIVLGYAMFDEFYQGFIPQRTSSMEDVWIDITGALMGIILFIIRRRDRDAKS